MHAIHQGELPPASLLTRYLGAYTDCYSVRIAQHVSQSEYVEAFYTTRLFKLERWLLARFVSRPSTDLQAKSLAWGDIDRFAAWRVEERNASELLLCDFTGRTRSWLMSQTDRNDPSFTWLYFGSAVVPKVDTHAGQATYGMGFHILLRFHRLYSVALLHSAVRRLRGSAHAPA